LFSSVAASAHDRLSMLNPMDDAINKEKIMRTVLIRAIFTL
jgi:hypothetical protein